MSASCTHWREYDNDHGIYEFCLAREKKCSCVGHLTQCHYPLLFNVPKHRLTLARKMQQDEETRQMADAFLIGGYKG